MKLTEYMARPMRPGLSLDAVTKWRNAIPGLLEMGWEPDELPFLEDLWWKVRDPITGDVKDSPTKDSER